MTLVHSLTVIASVVTFSMVIVVEATIAQVGGNKLVNKYIARNDTWQRTVKDQF